MEWESEYVDLASRYLSDRDREYLYQRFPELPQNHEDGCPTCGGKKEFFWRGQTLPCDCRQQLSLHKHYLLAGIGELYQRLSWEDYQGESETLRIAQGYVRRHQEMTSSGLGLSLLGPWGTGKTMVASLVAKELVKLGYSVYFTTFAGMIEMFTAGWKDQDERARFEQQVVQSKVLVLDDIGKEFRTRTNLPKSTFDHILRQRVTALRPTILTTNMSDNELEQGYGHAVLSLLIERSIQQRVVGEDYRETANKRAIDEALDGWRRPIF